MRTRLQRVTTIAAVLTIGVSTSAAFAPSATADPRRPIDQRLREMRTRSPRTPAPPNLDKVSEELQDRQGTMPPPSDPDRIIGATPPPAPTPAETAVATAKAQIGDPYRWGGNGPDAFDCSGLVSYAWARAGVTLPRMSRAQFAALPRVSLDALRPGDLVFSGYGTVTHVGMYIGGGNMVHSPNSGERVEIAPLHDNVIGAGRPDAS